MDGRGRKGNKIGDVLVAVVEIVGVFAGGREKDERAGGDGLGGVPDIGLVGRGVGAAELADAEEVLVDEALEEVEARGERAHGDAAAHTVEGHGDHGVAGLPTDGAVFGIVGDRPNAGLGLDESLISIVVVLGREVVDGGVLVEVVGGVGFTFGGRAVSHLAYARGRM